MTLFEAIILALIEGVTEFLPISSTGHMVIASSFMGIASEEFVKTYTVAIQFGAILSVLALYWRRFLQSVSFYVKLFVAFLPAAVAGFLLGDVIDELLENVTVVAISLLVGGLVLLFIDRLFAKSAIEGKSDLDFKSAFKAGAFQVLALVPGVSRSAATIIGGLSQNLNRRAAAEFSFFLAVPTMFAATGYSLYKFFKVSGGFRPEDYQNLAVGNIVAFLVAMLAIKYFIGYLSKYGFRIFGWYRIFVGILILTMQLMGISLQIV